MGTQPRMPARLLLISVGAPDSCLNSGQRWRIMIDMAFKYMGRLGMEEAQCTEHNAPVAGTDVVDSFLSYKQ